MLPLRGVTKSVHLRLELLLAVRLLHAAQRLVGAAQSGRLRLPEGLLVVGTLLSDGFIPAPLGVLLFLF